MLCGGVGPLLEAFLQERQIVPDAIISFDEYAVYTAAVMAASFGFRPIPLPASDIKHTNLKAKFREMCREYGVHSPKNTILHLPEWCKSFLLQGGKVDTLSDRDREKLERELTPLLADFTFPVVLKPSPGAGSLMARQCRDRQEVVGHALNMWGTFTNYPDSRHLCAVTRNTLCTEDTALSKCSEETQALNLSEKFGFVILVEEYIEGQEVDMDCVVENGELVFCSISDNFDTEPPYFVEKGGLCPSALPLEAKKELTKLLHQYLSMHKEHLHGVLHFEAKYDFKRKKAFVIEVNCRMGSAETNTMIRTCYNGLQLGESFVRCALGLSVREQLSRHVSPSATVVEQLGEGFFPTVCHCASVNLYPTRPGRLVEAAVPTELPYLVAYSVSANPGDLVAPPPTRFYLLCWMVCKGDTAEEAVTRITKATSLFRQEITPVCS
ncbi:hypothetical protein AGDE_07786 [Angomonas deanei]|nr:hypothetical protein AGDE_07786 [Angomonas deanei]|eukprot:EPY34850.1 hypothetical protein AGDE_07786 [Angomonas deanei]